MSFVMVLILTFLNLNLICSSQLDDMEADGDWLRLPTEKTDKGLHTMTSQMESVKPINGDFQMINTVQLDLQAVNKLIKRAESNEQTLRLMEAKHERLQRETIRLNEKLRIIEDSRTDTSNCDSRSDITLAVAFSAYTNSTSMQVVENKTIIFDRVLVNKGNGYDGTTGVFTVPISGAYQFSFQLATSYRQAAIAQLTLNDEEVLITSDGITNAGSAFFFSMTGSGLILNVSKGDRVCIVYEGIDAFFDKYSAFYGFLLYVN